MVFLEWANEIVYGDALEILKKAPSGFVDMAMTSPPYWGLRNYGEETCKIWDGGLECKHEWVESDVNYSQPHHGIGSKIMKIPCVTKETLNKPNPKSAFCHKCGAWYGQLGLEPLPDMYVKHLLQIFRELKRILKPTGSFYLNMGDTYAGSRCGSHDYRTDKCKNFTGREQYENKYDKPAPQATASIPRKSLCMIPERVALAMVSDGWILRNKIIWYKPNPMPASVKDRLNGTWEYLFHFVKRQKYYYNLDAIREPYTKPMNRWGGEKLKATGQSTWDEGTGQGTYRNRNMRPNPNGKNPGDVFKITTKACPEAHFAVYPEELCIKPIKSSCPLDGIILDPFCGAGTTCLVAKKLERRFIGIDINEKYCRMARKRLAKEDWGKRRVRFKGKAK